jgi:tRNA threonylcarbamoyladenosine biosynthesis protein TsaE
VSRSPAVTASAGARLGHRLGPGDVVCLQGDLGAGKTCLAQGIGRGLGVQAAVTSPTFVLINEYRLSGSAAKLYHIDLYRVESLSDACALGLEDYVFGNGICVIEWAERALELLPEERLWVSLLYLDDTTRCLRLRATGQRYTELVEALRRDGWPE